MLKSNNLLSVMLDILAFEQLLEEIEDIYFGVKAHKALEMNDEFISHSDVKRQNYKNKKVKKYEETDYAITFV